MKEIVGTWKPYLVNHAWSMLVGGSMKMNFFSIPDASLTDNYSYIY